MDEHSGTSDYASEDEVSELATLTPEALVSRLWSVADTAKILGGIGRTRVWQLRKEGHLTTVQIGPRRLVVGESIRKYMDSLISAASSD